MYPFIITLSHISNDKISKASRMESFVLRYPSESGHSKNMHSMPDAKKMAGCYLWMYSLVFKGQWLSRPLYLCIRREIQRSAFPYWPFVAYELWQWNFNLEQVLKRILYGPIEHMLRDNWSWASSGYDKTSSISLAKCGLPKHFRVFVKPIADGASISNP